MCNLHKPKPISAVFGSSERTSALHLYSEFQTNAGYCFGSMQKCMQSFSISDLTSNVLAVEHWGWILMDYIRSHPEQPLIILSRMQA
jgi:hypothetical protein